MREFFRGWKRKLRCATLGLASLLMAVWLRSHLWSDLIAIPKGRVVYGLELGQGMCVLFRSISSGSTLKRPLWRSSDVSQVTEPLDWWAGHAIIWQWNQAGCRVIVSLSGEHVYEDFVLSYAHLVIPLTLFSAWLLLSKPRTKPETPITPASENA